MAIPGGLKTELARKGIHLLIALVPGLAAVDRSGTALLLMAGTLFYAWAESMRFLGFSMPFVSSVTQAVLRKRELGNFALAPVTLGLGALLAMLLFPPKAAGAAIYALAFGDSASTIVGKFFGRIRPAFLLGKSLEGSLTCLAVTFLTSFFIFGNYRSALGIAITAAVIDMLPLGEFDNLLLPLTAGLAAVLLRH